MDHDNPPRDYRPYPDAPTGVGGWLALLVVSMILLGPLLALGGFIESTNPFLGWEQVKGWIWSIELLRIGLSIYGGWCLATRSDWIAVRRAIAVLWLGGPGCIVLLFVVLDLQFPAASSALGNAFALDFMKSIFAATLWTLYLLKSKRVRNTYQSRDVSSKNLSGAAGPGAEVRANSPAARSSREVKDTVQSVLSRPSMSGSLGAAEQIDEEAIYAQIAEELDKGSTDRALWIRLFAECGGDDKAIKVAYIKARADRLIASERARLAQADSH